MSAIDLRTALRAATRTAARRGWGLVHPLPRLDRYAPQSLLRLQSTDVSRARFPVIDAHNHLGRWLSRDGSWMISDVSALVAVMDRLGVAAVVNLDGRFGPELSENVERYDAAYPGRFATFSHMDWTVLGEPGGFARLPDQLSAAVARGAVGLKVWKDLGRSVRDVDGRLVLVDDPRLADLWATAGQLDIPVLVHVADPPAFFRPADRFNERLEELHRHPRSSWRVPGLPSYDRLMDALESAIATTPSTTWIGAHVASRVEDLAGVDRLLRTYQNLLVDIAARAADLGRQPRAAGRLFTAHPDRILFGTDVFPFRPDELRIYLRLLETADECFAYSTAPVPPAGRWTISGLDLDESTLRAVYSDNARRVLPSLSGSVSASS